MTAYVAWSADKALRTENAHMPDQHADLVVEANGLTKVFKDFWGRPKANAVNGIDLAVRPGQVFGLLGPNGSGKSTTVKLILGLLYPTRGTLKVFGQSPRDVDIKHKIGYLPEESYLYRYLTAGETLDFFGALFGLAQEERERRIDQLLEMVGLTNSRHRPVGEFSKGMARRIGLAQALINDPSLVILDEPTSGLDPIGCGEVKDVIRLLAQRGKTVILCSHLLSDVQDVCDEVAVLYGGRIRTRGELSSILTVQDKTRIVSPKLDDVQAEEILDLIREKTGGGDVLIDQPTMDLESFFLDVVHRAREASVETAGAQAGGQIASYLRGQEDQDDGPAVSADLLQALSGTGGESASGPEMEPGPAPETEPEAATAVDELKLEELTAEDPSSQEEERSVSEAEQKADAAKKGGEANKRLEELLGDDDKDA